MSKIYCNQSAIKKIIPHRDPFLFVDHVIDFQRWQAIVAERFLSSKEYFFQGHFPDTPIMPGVLVTEALAQTSGLMLGLSAQAQQVPEKFRPQNLYLASVDMKFLSPARPGETLILKSTLKKKFGSLVLFNVAAEAGDRLVAKGSLALGEGD